jgi:tetratricopeptide (TPR) repeat protein
MISQNIKPFDENIDILCQELELAVKWERPSILLAIHKSKFGQDKAARTLEQKLNKLGQTVLNIVVNPENPDPPHAILATPDLKQTVFFVSNIDQGGGPDNKETYRALNVYRELFVEKQIRVVFWLTTSEAANIPQHAPDFWAFRHRVIEFAAQRTHGNVNLPAGIMIWQVQNSIDSFDKPAKRIAAREDILAKLPNNTEALSTRVDLLYNIGYLYWVLGNSKRALQSFTTGMDQIKNIKLPQIRSNLLNGIAIIYYEANQYDKAMANYKEATSDNPEDPGLLINLSAVCCALGKNQEALTLGKKALKMKNTDAKIWNRFGYIYCVMAKYDEAINCFKKAVGLAPSVIDYQVSLCVSYSLIERMDEAKRIIGAIRKSAGGQSSTLLDIYEHAVTGDQEKSLELLRKALDADQVSSSDVRRDPNINLLFEMGQIDALMH